MKLHHSVQSNVSDRLSRFKIRYNDNQPLKPNFKSTLSKLSKNEHKITNGYLISESELFLHSPKKTKRQNNMETQISTPHNIERTKPIKRIQSIDNFIDKEDYSKVPIEYYDERDHGCPADRIKARIVYRGYAPKNTYFYLKTIREVKHQQVTPLTSNPRTDYEIKFNSKFESGNLIAASRINSKEYWLFMRQDTNTNGIRQWYYFEVYNRKPIAVKFRIYRFTKHYSLYKEGMKPFVKVGNDDWRQQGQKIRYQYDSQQRCFFLEFEFNFQQSNTYTYFATLPPYSYTHLIQYLNTLKEIPYVKMRILGKSLAGLDIPIIEIKKKMVYQPNSMFSTDHIEGNKEAIFIMARTHPGQTCSNFTLESFIEKMIGNYQQTSKSDSNTKLLDIYDFYIVPMVNPDGVYLGNHRTNALGVDLNRYFFQCDAQLFPQVSMVIEQIHRIRKITNIKFLIDLHGHSAKKNIFAYGQQHEIGSKKHLLSRILPKILSDTISIFKYDHCVFRGVKQKKNTARVYFSHKFQLNSITFQQSYGLINEGNIGIMHWRSFGVALYESLEYFAKNYKNNLSQLELYLKHQIQHQKIKIQRRLDKQKRMLESLKIIKEDNKSVYSLQSTVNIIQSVPSLSTHRETPSQMLSKIQEQQEKSSVKLSELDSGDQDLELGDDQLQVLRRQIVRVGCLKEGYKRQLFMMADKKLQLLSWERNSQPRLHQQRSSLAPRILKLQMKKKQVTIPVGSLFRDRGVELPNIKR